MWAHPLHFFWLAIFPISPDEQQLGGFWYLGFTGFTGVKLKSVTVDCLSTGSQTHRQTDRQRKRERDISCLTAALIRCIAGYPQEMRTVRKHNSSCRLTPHIGGPANQEKTPRNVSNNKIKKHLDQWFPAKGTSITPKGGNLTLQLPGGNVERL